MAGLFPFAAIDMMWYAVPLIVVISLVYSATRQEAMNAILSNSLRLGFMISLFMIAIMAVLALVSWRI